MEKVKWLLLSLILVITSSVKAQSDDFADNGLLKAQLTLSPSYLFSEKQSLFYLHGNLEYYLQDQISVAGEGYFFMGSSNGDSTIFDYNHSGFFGLSKHYVKGNSDFYIGLQPGISITKLKSVNDSLPNPPNGVNPLFSVISGYNYFVGNYVHFFIQMRYVGGQNNYGKALNINELRLSAGLGFNLKTKRRKYSD
ncbi:MAG TPA: hypothetical protein PLG57_08800 [Bacteroidia bacterium]|jgi:hypothetical protein|nr:hypothetical protein [Bacteroidia bacterium]